MSQVPHQPADVTDASVAFRHPVRLAILHMLSEGGKKRSELSEGVNVANSMLQTHIDKLRSIGLIDVNDVAPERGRPLIYTLNPTKYKRMMDSLKTYLPEF